MKKLKLCPKKGFVAAQHFFFSNKRIPSPTTESGLEYVIWSEIPQFKSKVKDQLSLKNVKFLPFYENFSRVVNVNE